MTRFVIRRIIHGIPTLFLVALFTFSIVHLAPGDPALGLVPVEEQTPELLAAVRAEWHLNDPMPVQFATWLERVAHGDLGKSITTRQPVGQLIMERLPVTLELAAAALLISTVVGVLLGIVAALHQRGVLDSSTRVGSLIGVSVPGFVFGILLILIFGWYWPGVIPYNEWVPISDSVRGNLSHLILPAITLALAPIGIISRLTRSSMLDELGLDYVRMARATGVPWQKIVWHDALKNALLPVVTVIGVIAAHLFGGAVIVETIFGLPGLGRLLIVALQGRDYPLVSGIVLTIAVLVMLTNLCVDLVYAWLNPRIAQSYRTKST